jgi:hypothetical protein
MQAIIFCLAWASPAGSASAAKSALRGPWRRFPGLAAPIPCPRLVSGFLGVPARPGRGSRASLAVAVLLGVQPAAFPLALPFDVGHGLGKPLFPAKPLLAGLSAGAVLDVRADGVELAPARRAAPWWTVWPQASHF